jgi:predicted DNA-binding transcriptional regulator AlpA
MNQLQQQTPEQVQFDARYITSTEIGVRLNVTRPTLFNYRQSGKLPNSIAVNDGRLFVWERSAVEPYIAALEKQQ